MQEIIYFIDDGNNIKVNNNVKKSKKHKLALINYFAYQMIKALPPLPLSVYCIT